MPITVDAGDSSQGLRRAFGLTGRIPLALDETAVPTALVRDASRPPYASEPRYCYGLAVSNADATHFASLTLENNTFKVGDNVAGVVAVVDKVIFGTNSTFHTYTFALARKSILLGLANLSSTVVVGNDDGGTPGPAPQQPRCQLFQDGITAKTGTFFADFESPPSNIPITYELGGIVLYANDIFQVANGSMTAGTHFIICHWREFSIRAS